MTGHDLKTWDCVSDDPADQIAARDAFYARLHEGLDNLEEAFGATVVEHVVRELNEAASAADRKLDALALERVRRHAG